MLLMWWYQPVTSNRPRCRVESVDCFSEYLRHTGVWFVFTVTLFRHEIEALRSDALQTKGTWKRQLCILVWTENIFFTAFRKRWRHDNHVISLTQFSSNTNLNWPVIVAFLNSSSGVWTENILRVFRVKPPLSICVIVVCTLPQLTLATSFPGSLFCLPWSERSWERGCLL